MFQTFEQAQAFVAERGVRMIDLKFCDLWGRWRSSPSTAQRA
jgi:glutamine synthetase